MASPFSRTLRALEADGHRRWMAGLIPALLLLSAWSVWFVRGKVAVYEVTDRAWLAVDREAHPIAAPVEGRVAAVRVVLGQAVRQGQVLIELEAEEQRARLDEERARRDALAGQTAALRQQIAAGGRFLAGQVGASRAAIEETRAKAREAEAAARLAEQEADRQARLLADGLVSAAEAERTRSAAEQRRAAADSLKQTLGRLAFEERSAEGERRGDVEELEQDLALLEGQASSSAATIRRLEREVGLRTLRAPVAGRVGQLAAVRVGSVVAAGEQLGMVVPQGELKAIAEFEPVSALGRIRPSQPARIVLSGFPSAQYGHLTARVARVASEPRDGRIRVELALRPDRRSRLPLQHGLPGTVEVEVEKVSPAVLVLRTVGKVFDRPIAEGN
ncbi:MAG TPA: HlyD family efflux transporter periplasmic adaptor subunit [Thermoanaerobaculia bacterium]|jgi:membrane fusion protein (multidrug efflux system)|nr:HlyD family efflux transporter periplasmic adaptor subunit [Thermoanaerobaculia bacterium]